MLAERTPGGWGCLDKRGRCQNRMAKLLGQVLHANNLVDGGPHEGELQAVWNANVAIDDFTEMECDAEIEV